MYSRICTPGSIRWTVRAQQHEPVAGWAARRACGKAAKGSSGPHAGRLRGVGCDCRAARLPARIKPLGPSALHAGRSTRAAPQGLVADLLYTDVHSILILVLWRVSKVQRAAILTATQLGTYDHVKHFILNLGWLKEGYPLHFCSGVVAGFGVAVTTSPVDTLRTRLMNQPLGTSDIDDSSTSFYLDSRTLMGCTDPLRRGSAHPISALSVR